MARSSSGESVIERVVRILDAFGPEARSLSVSDVARRAGLPLSTAARLVDEMVGQGLLRRDERRQVRIGLRLWELASRASPTLGLREAAMPFMEDLHGVVGHHTQLGILQNSEVLFVERLSAPGAVANVTHIAGRLPLHASSSGLALLASAPTDVQERLLAGHRQQLTPNTVVEERALRCLLADIRQKGYAFCPGFIDLAAAGIAVPLKDGRNRVVAALSVIVPNDDRAVAAVPAVQAAARGIQRALGTPIAPRS